MYKKHIDLVEVAEFVKACSLKTKIYIGCDSERLQIDSLWYADYITAVVIHIDGKHGCKIFGAVDRDRDYEHRIDKPRMRLMNEVYRVANLYLELSKVVEHDIQVHLDINPDDKHNSSIVINEAVGYIRGMCGVTPMVKPLAFAASTVADRYKELRSQHLVA